MTTRVIDLRGGKGHEELARGLGRTDLARAEQVHGPVVVPLEAAPPGPVRGADGLATRSRTVLLALGADCPGVALLGEASVAVAHSGWRGAVADIGPNAVEALVALGEERSRLRAFVGPGIGVCCFEVGDEVVAAFEHAHGPLGSLVERRRKAHDCGDAMPPSVRLDGGARPHIDLKGAIARRLVERAGLRPEHVTVAPECTRCSPDKFFSRRREGPGCGHHAVAAFLR